MRPFSLFGQDFESTPLIKNNTSLKRHIIASSITGQILIIYGISQGYSSILVDQLGHADSPIKITIDQASWIASIGWACQLIGALAIGYTVDKFGRKFTMQGIMIVITFSWLLTSLSNDISMIYLSRILMGLVLGMASIPGIYTNETTKSTYRGTIFSLFEMCVVTGLLIVYILGYLLSWKTMAILLFCHSFMVLFLFFYIPESFVWYMATGKKTKAIESMMWFENDYRIVESSIKALQIRLETITWTKNYLYVFQHRKLRNRFVMFSVFLIFQQSLGTVILFNYAVSFFKSLRTTYNGNVLSIIFGIIGFVSSINILIITHKYKRKTLISFSGLGMAFFMAAAAYTFSIWHTCTIITLICIFMYVWFTYMGILVVSQIVIAESFPTKARGTVTAIHHVIMYFMSFVCTKSYPFFNRTVGVHGVLLYLAILPFIAAIYAIIFFPETKDKSIVEMENESSILI